MGYFKRLFRALFNIKPKKENRVEPDTSFIDELHGNVSEYDSLDKLDLSQEVIDELKEYLTGLDVYKTDPSGSKVESLSTKICKDIILNPLDWDRDKYHFFNQKKGVKFWIANGERHFKIEEPDDIQLDKDDLTDIWKAYDSWFVVKNASNQSELAKKF